MKHRLSNHVQVLQIKTHAHEAAQEGQGLLDQVAMAVRTRKARHDDFTRTKIQVSQLINRLTNHALGKVELSPTQVRSIEILLRKTLPDLSSIEHSGEMALRRANEMSDDELATIAANRGEGATAPPLDPSKLN